MSAWGQLLPWRTRDGKFPPEPPHDAYLAKELHDGALKLLAEQVGPGLIEPEPPRRRKQDRGPFAFLPRWALAVAAAGGLLASGAWLNERTQVQTRLEQAIADAPGKYTSRLGERLADVEATTREHKEQIAVLRAAVEKDRLDVKADRKEFELLLRQVSVEMGTLTTEVRAMRR